MSLPNPSYTPITNTGTRTNQDGPLATTTKINTDFAAALANDVSLDSRIVNLEQRLLVPVGSITPPSANPFTYATGSTPWTTATVSSTVISAANSLNSTATSKVYDVFYLQTKSSGTKVFLAIVQTATYPGILPIFLNGTTLTFGTIVSGNVSGGVPISYEITGSTTVLIRFALSGTANLFTYNPSTDAVTVATQNANFESGSAGFSFALVSAPAPNALLLGGNRQSISCGNQSTACFTPATFGSAASPIALATVVSRNAPTNSVDALYKMLGYWAGTTVPSIGFDVLSTNLFLVAGLTKHVGETQRLGIFLVYCDDTGARVLADLSFNSPTATGVSVFALNPTTAIVYWNNGSTRCAMAINVINSGTGIQLAVQSPYYINTTGVQQTLLWAMNYGANDQYMITKESGSNNSFGVRRLTFDPTLAHNPSLYEQGSAAAFSFGAGLDTTSTFQYGPVCKVPGADQFIMLGASGAAASGVTVANAAVASLVSLS